MKLSDGKVAALLAVLISATYHAHGTVMTYTDQASFLAATNSISVDNFDADPWVPTYTPFPPLTQPVVSLGNSWTANNGLSAVTSASFSGAQSISSIDTSPDLIDMLSAALGGTVTAVGGFVRLNLTNGVSLNIFDVVNNLLGSVNSTAISGWQFIGLTSDTAIARLQFVSTSQPNFDDFVLDDFHFGSSAVFEPATLALIGLGLASMGYGRRRENQAV